MRKFLCIGTEWFSKKGGLTTFNRKLCEVLAKKHKVYCYVEEYTNEEFNDAKSKNVTLVSPKRVTGSSFKELMLTMPPIPKQDWPDVVIGHDRITGSSMEALCMHHCKNAKKVFFIHTNPEEIERFKPEQTNIDSAAKTEERTTIQKKLAQHSSLIVAVGPGLHRYIKALMDGVKPKPPIIRFDPGLYDAPENIDYTFESDALETMIMGRLEDFELKGVDVAVHAMDIANEKVSDIKINGSSVGCNLIIRGTPVGTKSRLIENLNKLSPKSKVTWLIKNYTPDAEVITQDIRRTAITLMPSKSEGFGLVALEALSLGRPALISENSGIAMLLRELAPDQCHHWIVPGGPNEDNIGLWADMIAVILRDRKAAALRLKQLVEIIHPKLSWQKSVDELEKHIDALTQIYTLFDINDVGAAGELHYHPERKYDNAIKEHVGDMPDAVYNFANNVISIERKDNEGRNIIDLRKEIEPIKRSVGMRKINVFFRTRTNGKAVSLFVILHKKGEYEWFRNKMFSVKGAEWVDCYFEAEVPWEMNITVQLQERDFKGGNVIVDIKDLVVNDIHESA